METPGQDSLTQQTVDIVAAYVANNNVRTEDLGNLINTVRTALGNAGARPAASAKAEPPMPWKKAIRPDFIISFEDGKHYKSMKRHLTRYGLTPDQYREKWGLPRDFPMVAPNYAAARSELAKKSGLGQKGAARRSKKGSSKKAAA